MSLVQFRLNVDVQKEQLLEEERMVRALEKQKQINDIKNARSNELRILVEMGFERQCGTDEKLGVICRLLLSLVDVMSNILLREPGNFASCPEPPNELWTH